MLLDGGSCGVTGGGGLRAALLSGAGVVDDDELGALLHVAPNSGGRVVACWWCGSGQVWRWWKAGTAAW